MDAYTWAFTFSVKRLGESADIDFWWACEIDAARHCCRTPVRGVLNGIRLP